LQVVMKHLTRIGQLNGGYSGTSRTARLLVECYGRLAK
jgi:hypothetical protein